MTRMSRGALELTEETLPVAGGMHLHVRHWRHQGPGARPTVVVLHGYMEHGGRYAELAHTLHEYGMNTTAPDLRGHGRSRGQRGYVARFADYVDDAACVLDALDPARPHFVVGHSNGALVALLLAAQQAVKVAGLVVSNPFLRQTHPVRGPKLWLGTLAAHLWPRLSLPAGLDPADLTHDGAQMAAHRGDPAIFNVANASWFAQVQRAQKTAMGLQRLQMPLLYIYSDADPVASPHANASLAHAIEAPTKRIVVRRGAGGSGPATARSTSKQNHRPPGRRGTSPTAA